MIFNSVVAFRLWGSDPVLASLQKALQGKGTKGDVSISDRNGGSCIVVICIFIFFPLSIILSCSQNHVINTVSF